MDRHPDHLHHHVIGIRGRLLHCHFPQQGRNRRIVLLRPLDGQVQVVLGHQGVERRPLARIEEQHPLQTARHLLGMVDSQP